MNFSFFVHRFFYENLEKFISQMGTALWVFGTSQKVKKLQTYYRGIYGPLTKCQDQSDSTVEQQVTLEQQVNIDQQNEFNFDR